MRDVGVVLEEAGEVVSVFMDEEEAIAAKVFDKEHEEKRRLFGHLSL